VTLQFALVWSSRLEEQKNCNNSHITTKSVSQLQTLFMTGLENKLGFWKSC